MMMTCLMFILAIYAIGGAYLTWRRWVNKYPLTRKHRGRTRPHWSAWADIACWPIWLTAGLSVMLGEALGDAANRIMAQVDRLGEHLMNPMFDFIDPPIEPAKGISRRVLGGGDNADGVTDRD